MSLPVSQAPKISLACLDWVEKLKAGRSPVADIDLNVEEAGNAVAIFNRLRLPDVPGAPALKDAAGQWSRTLVSYLFGSVAVNSRGFVTSRFIRKFFVLVPKKNAKTTTGAAIMLVALLKNKRPRGEFLLIGPTQAIAQTAFSQAVGIIGADPDGYLQNRFQIREAKLEIVDRENAAVLKIKTFNTNVLTGVKPVGVLIDELHELGKMPNAEKVLTQLRGGIIANPEAFLIYITTQSDDQPAGVFKSELAYVRDIRDGRIGGDTLPMLFEFPLEMQKDKKEPWRDSDVWPMVLPNLGKSITLDILKTEFNEAAIKGKETLSLWLSQHLNIEIGLGMHRDRWRGADYWEDAGDDGLSLDEILSRSEVVVAGIDGGGLDDLFGLGIMGRCKETKKWLLWSKAWVHPDALEERAQIATRLEDFEKDGSLKICDYATQEIDEVADLIERIHLLGLFPESAGIGLDPQGVSALVDEIEGRNIPDGVMVAVPQGYKLSGAVWGMERKLKNKTLLHSNLPMMAWCVGNAKAEQRGNAVYVTKQAAGKAKIDPLIAAYNAFVLMTRNPVAANSNVSAWEDEGFDICA